MGGILVCHLPDNRYENIGKKLESLKNSLTDYLDLGPESGMVPNPDKARARDDLLKDVHKIFSSMEEHGSFIEDSKYRGNFKKISYSLMGEDYQGAMFATNELLSRLPNYNNKV